MPWQPALPPDPEPLRTAGGRFYDLETLLVSLGDAADEQTPDEFLTSRQTYQHERCHYLQHLGTTLGAFLGLLRFDRLQTCLEWVAGFPPEVRAGLAAGRATAGRAIVPLERNSDPPLLRLAFESGASEDLDIFRQIVFDNWLLWWLFYDVRTAQGIAGHQPGEATVPLVLRDAGLRAHRFFGTPHYGEAGSLRVSDSWSPFRADDGTRFGTPSLFEGAALANEFQFLLRAGVSRGVIDRRFDELIGGTYGLALRHYMRRAGVAGRDEMLADPYTHLWYFLVAVDVALNPGLPPVVTAAPGCWDWSALNPAHRFCKALTNLWVFDIAAPRSPEEATDHAAVTRAVDMLAEACGFAKPSTFRFPATGGTRLKAADFVFPDFRITKSDPANLRGHLEAGYDPYEYAVLLHRQAWAERATNLPAIIFSGLLGGRFYYHSGGPGFLMHSGQCRPGLFYPPMILNPATGTLSVGLGTDADHAAALAYGTIRDKMIEDCFWRTGGLTLRGGFDVARAANPAFQRSVELELARLFGRPVW